MFIDANLPSLVRNLYNKYIIGIVKASRDNPIPFL